MVPEAAIYITPVSSDESPPKKILKKRFDQNNQTLWVIFVVEVQSFSTGATCGLKVYRSLAKGSNQKFSGLTLKFGDILEKTLVVKSFIKVNNFRA